jgi:hypothetical protein
MTIEENLVLFLQLKTRMGNSEREFSIVREQQKSGRWAVQSTDRHDTLRHFNEIEHSQSSTFVTCSRDISGRFVENYVAGWFILNDFSIDLDLLARRIDPKPEGPHDFAVDRNPSIGDHLFGLSAGCNPSRGKHFV